MTSIVGILCSDRGCVIGSDSCGVHLGQSFGAGHPFTSIQTIPHLKTHVCGPDVLVASTGCTGLCQRAASVIELLRQQVDFSQATAMTVSNSISAATLDNLALTRAPPGHLSSLAAFVSQDGPELYSFQSITGYQPERLTPGSWFRTAGSGQALSDGFLAFLRRALLQGRQPRLDEAVLATCWTLLHTIDAGALCVAPPLQIGVLAPDASGQFAARLLSEDEIELHTSRVQDAERAMSSVPVDAGGKVRNHEMLTRKTSVLPCAADN